MRSHSEIVAKAGVERLAVMRGVSIHTATSWKQRNSIPAEHWKALSEARIASLTELAAAAAAKPARKPARKQVTA